MNFKDWMWTRKTTEEIRREAFQPNHDEREFCTSASFDARLEAIRNADSILDAAIDQLASHESKASPTARVFLMPLKIERIISSVRYLSLRGYRMKFRKRHVEMVI